MCLFRFLADDILHNLGTIGPKAEVKYVLDMTGTKLGAYTVTAGLSSDKVEHVTGEIEVWNTTGHAQTGQVLEIMGPVSMCMAIWLVGALFPRGEILSLKALPPNEALLVI